MSVYSCRYAVWTVNVTANFLFLCVEHNLLTHHSDISTTDVPLLHSASWIWQRVFKINNNTVTKNYSQCFLSFSRCNINMANMKTCNEYEFAFWQQACIHHWVKAVLFSQVEAILVNIFGGIVNCAIIANGITKACRELELKVPLVVRLEGRKSALQPHLLTETNPDPSCKPVPADTVSDTVRVMHHLHLNHGTLISV